MRPGRDYDLFFCVPPSPPLGQAAAAAVGARDFSSDFASSSFPLLLLSHLSILNRCCSLLLLWMDGWVGALFSWRFSFSFPHYYCCYARGQILDD
uniref:Uncharacterized protein n=1 Tax=Oryza brachyantha TaxID=4533 RepID=J3MXR5_ORYBR